MYYTMALAVILKQLMNTWSKFEHAVLMDGFKSEQSVSYED